MAFLAALTVFAAPSDERAAYLREKITTLERVAENTKNTTEKARINAQLERVRGELKFVEQQQGIDAREKELQAGQTKGTRDLLREKLRISDFSTEDAEARIKQINVRRKQAAQERDALASLIDPKNSGSTAQVQLQERIFTKDKELRALAFEREEVEREIEVAHDTEELRKRLKSYDEVGEHPTLRALFEAYTVVREGRKAGNRLASDLASLEQNLNVSQGELGLAQQKIANFAEELALLEKQVGIFVRDERIEKLLVEERGQKDVLSDRIPFLARQVDALRKSQVVLASRQELANLEANLKEEQLQALKIGYLHRLRWPAVALTALLLIHLLAGYLILPLLYKNEMLVLSRRLVRYGMVLAALLVLVGFLFDDVKVVATAGGLVTAAFVVALKDVCMSICGWFVIMIGRKFSINDRLEVEGVRGDVIDIELFRTTLLEVNGWLGTDTPTGRVLTLPNSFVFTAKVFNYNHEHPYIWGKVELTITFGTAVGPAVTLLTRVLEEETREQFAAAQKAAAGMYRRYGVEDAVYKPKVQTFIGEHGTTISMFYVTHYREMSSNRTRLNRRFFAELEKHPEIQLSSPTLHISHGKPTEPAAILGDDGDSRGSSHGNGNGNGNGSSLSSIIPSEMKLRG